MSDETNLPRRKVISTLATLSAGSVAGVLGISPQRASPLHTSPLQGGSDAAGPSEPTVAANPARFHQEGRGAVSRSLLDKARDVVSVLDFGAVADGTLDGATGIVTGTNSSAAFNMALATGKNVFVPAGTYVIGSPVQIKTEGQVLFGDGTYTTELLWTGTNDRESIVELLSGRRDGNSGATATGMRLSGFKISSAVGSACYSAIWIEAGVFHSEVSNVRLWPFFGTVGDAFIKLSSDKGDSYPVNCVLRDIVGTGIANGSKNPVPRGVWVESAIEAFFERVVMYSVGHGWVLGAEDGHFDNVENCTFIRCHAEIGDRGFGLNDGAALLITAGSNINFYACKFTAGINDQAEIRNVSDQVSVLFRSPDPSKIIRSVNFHGCNLWQLGQGVIMARPPVVFDHGAAARDVAFQGCRVNSVNGFISNLCDASVTERDTSYEASIPPAGGISFEGRMGCRATPSGMAANSLQTINGLEEHSAFGLPVQVSSDHSLSGVHLSWYKTTTTGLNLFSLWNPINGSRVPFGGTRGFSMQHFRPDNIKARVCRLWDPGATPPNEGQTTLVPCPGAQFGDFVKAGFSARSTGGLDNHVVHAWVSATGLVSVRLFNPTSTTRNFAQDALTVFHLAPDFDFIASFTCDPPPLSARTAVSEAISVPGSSLSDFVEVSFSVDNKGVIMWGEVTETDTVTIHMFNSMPDTVDLPRGVLIVGVRKRHTLL